MSANLTKLDSIDCREALDDAGTEIPGTIEFGIFAGEENRGLVQMTFEEAKVLWRDLGKLLFPPDLEQVDIASLHQKARELHCDGSDDDIELDDVEHYTSNEPLSHRISIADDGFWIQAWLYVPAPDSEDLDDEGDGT